MPSRLPSENTRGTRIAYFVLKWLSHSSNDHLKFGFLISNGAQRAAAHFNWWRKLSNLFAHELVLEKEKNNEKIKSCVCYCCRWAGWLETSQQHADNNVNQNCVMSRRPFPPLPIRFISHLVFQYSVYKFSRTSRWDAMKFYMFSRNSEHKQSKWTLRCETCKTKRFARRRHGRRRCWPALCRRCCRRRRCRWWWYSHYITNNVNAVEFMRSKKNATNVSDSKSKYIFLQEKSVWRTRAKKNSTKSNQQRDPETERGETRKVTERNAFCSLQ